MKNNLLKNKVAVVFGAAGNLGKQVAKAFTDQGADVYLSDIKSDVLRNLSIARNIQTVDALNEAEVEEYMDTVASLAGRIDIVINLSASETSEYNHGKPATEVSLDQFLIPMKTTTGTQFVTAKAAYKHMSRQKSGVVIFITSTLSKIAPPWTTALTASHAATEALTKTLAQEWGPEGIRVICVRSEAMTESSTIDYTFTTMGANIGISREEMQASVEEKVPLKRLTNGMETAQVAVLAASDLAGFMTGTMLNHSGGHVLE
ncbi:SDR family NAD(P)-dependent oxidoreductase [Xanthovirga aplysinae]|uniref:SDR family NAD(P)-dependent oxidoreductase n=1 Tax=Xanthovirga aplysinae TaxID=2529853 RepID=UPI0012BD2BFD|nr:SDR family oxidoreductase [Xanthovirga aplysinae]MTI31343.1 SDR family oxidoreductase [Xanthovirga aplysinae]